MSEAADEFSISIDQVQDYEFRVAFDNQQLAGLTIDEPPPLGNDAGPNPSRLLAAAIGGCLSASLLFCARKSRVQLGNIHSEIKVRIMRGENRRLRIGKVEVSIEPELNEQDRGRMERCVGLFEDFCTVTQSIRDGIDVEIKVKGFEAQ
jgi:organic hydroperoxide reductase OsmC/OhrA